MSEIIHIKEGKPEELIQAEKLIDDAKVNEAHELLSSFLRKEGLPLHERVLGLLLRCELLYQQGHYNEVATLAEQIFKESFGLGKNLLSIDALMWMARALIHLDMLNKANNRIKQGEELLKTFIQEVPFEYKQREALLAFAKGDLYRNFGDKNQALEYHEYSLELREELGIVSEIAHSLSLIALLLCEFKGEIDRALKYADRGLALAKKSGKKFSIAICLNYLAAAYAYRGELNRCVILFEQSLAIWKELNNKTMIAGLLNNVGEKYRLRGELDRALECLEQSLVINKELGNLKSIANVHDFLIQILIDKGDLEQAWSYLDDFKQMNRQLKNKLTNLAYFFNKALLLKTSIRARNRVKAEEIFFQLLGEEDLGYDMTIRVLLNLCELLLIELRMTNEVEVLDEIRPLIARLLDIAEKSNSYMVLSESYLLQAKLALLTFDIKKAQQLLSQAHQIAKNFGLNQLAEKITSENEDLSKKLDLWEKLKESGAPMTDRFELARLDEKVISLFNKNVDLITRVSLEEVAISKEKKICLVCRGEVLRFSYICECGAIYCESCARALTNIENVCWVCDVPIDYSKPAKLYDKEREEIKVEERAKKK